jgi:hypothetical protein
MQRCTTLETALMPSLRSLGYRVRVARPGPIIDMLERAGLRPHPWNRVEPRSGHWSSTCPICGEEDGLYVEPGLDTWTASCTRGEFGVLELHAVMTGRSA